jgi:hypothetical protein
MKFARLLYLLALLALVACTPIAAPTTSGNGPGHSVPVDSSGMPAWGHQTKTSGCQVQGVYPDPACTPGDILANVTAKQVCVSGYSSSVRNVPDSEKNAVYAEYGITHHSEGEYEVDHFVSLELGGSNDISNLWPEAANPTPGFHQKDQVENQLHDKVCSGALTLAEAQRQIATDWLAVYNGLPPGLVTSEAPVATQELIAATATLAGQPAPTQSSGRARTGATCQDGSSSTNTGSGACSGHGGVKCWTYTDGTCTKP